MRALILCLALTSCATQSVTVEQYPVTNVAETCASPSRKIIAANDAGCMERTATSCVAWLKTSGVWYSDYGQLWRACFK